MLSSVFATFGNISAIGILNISLFDSVIAMCSSVCWFFNWGCQALFPAIPRYKTPYIEEPAAGDAKEVLID